MCCFSWYHYEMERIQILVALLRYSYLCVRPSKTGNTQIPFSVDREPFIIVYTLILYCQYKAFIPFSVDRERSLLYTHSFCIANIRHTYHSLLTENRSLLCTHSFCIANIRHSYHSLLINSYFVYER